MKFYDFSNYEYCALIGVSEREKFHLDVALEAYMEEVEEICDNICILDKGKIIAQGSLEYLQSNIMNTNIYTIVLKNKVDNLERYIRQINGIEDVSINNKIIKCSYSKDKNVLQKLINTIFNNGGVIESIKNELPTLESVFLNLTGKKLRN